MSVPICRSCCAKTGRTVLTNSFSKCPDTGQSNRQFSKDPNHMTRDEWNFIRNFGHEMYKNYLLMRSLKKDTTCTSRLSQWLSPGSADKPAPEKTAKKAVKKGELKILPSIPFIHNFDFLKKLNYVVGTGAGKLSRPLKAQQQRTYEDSSGGKLRAAAKFPKIATTASQPFHKLLSSEGPVNAVSLTLAHVPGVGRVHANWFGHDIGYKIAPETGAVALDFVTSPTAALAGQRNEAFESKVPKERFRSKTTPKTKMSREVGFISKHRAFGDSPYSDGQERNLRFYNDLMRMESFRRKRADMLKYGIAPGTLRGFEHPMYTGEALDGLGYVGDDIAYLQRISDPQQDNMFTMAGGLGNTKMYLRNVGVSDQIQSPGTVHENGIPRGLGHFPYPDSLRYSAEPRQNYLNSADGGVDGGKSGFPLQDKAPITAARLGNKEVYKYLTGIGVLPQANVKGTVDVLHSSKTRSAGSLSNDRHSKYIPFVEFPRQALRSGLGNMEAYKYLRHFGAPLHGNIARAARGFRKFEDSNYLGHTVDLQRDYMVDAAGISTKYLQYGGDPRQMEKADNYKQNRQFGDQRQEAVVGTAGLGYVDAFDYPNRTVDPQLVNMMGPVYGMGDAEANQYLKYTGDPSGEFERRKFPKQLATSRAQAPAAASKYIGNSGNLRENRVRRRRKAGPFTNTKFARYPGQTGIPGIVGTTGGRESFEIIKRPSINLRPSQMVRRETGLMTREPPQYMRHIVIPRREDSSGIEADLAYIREDRLPKQYKTAAQGPLTYTKFPGYVGRTFGTLPANAGLGNFEARKSIRRLIPFPQTRRFGSFPGYNFRDPWFSRYSRPPRQGTTNDFRYAEAAKNIRSSRVHIQRPPYLDYNRDSTYARHPMIRHRKSGRGPFDYSRFARYEGKISQNFQANAFGGDPYGMGYFETDAFEIPGGNIHTDPLEASRFGKVPRKHLRKSEKIVDEEENMQRLVDILAQEQEDYIYDPGYTGHIHPFYSGFMSTANYGLNELHQLNSVLLSTEEQRERDTARLESLNLFYNIINSPDMEMEVLVPEDTARLFDYNIETKLAHIKENKLSLKHVAKLLKGDRKKKFRPVLFHEPFDKEKPWTWIQNFPIRIPNEVLRRLSTHSLQSLKSWQRQQTLMRENSADQSPQTLNRDKKRRH